ncbi:hypothetical protein DDZ15_00960 [Rhodohalobacter mucosus]|uniref:Uncharacterized protein n=1 Tax=Rhodohalobacter mucosus TaxID=2079485 RepID=A0A316TUP4_9BACT|nr:hypothetical protein DDZ15_00960 [Rhodohalobacter mucosus]
MVHGAGCRVQGAGCRVQGAGCRVQGAGKSCWKSEIRVRISPIRDPLPVSLLTTHYSLLTTHY